MRPIRTRLSRYPPWAGTGKRCGSYSEKRANQLRQIVCHLYHFRAARERGAQLQRSPGGPVICDVILHYGRHFVSQKRYAVRRQEMLETATTSSLKTKVRARGTPVTDVCVYRNVEAENETYTESATLLKII